MNGSILSTPSLRRWLRKVGLHTNSVQVVLNESRTGHDVRVYVTTRRQRRIAEGHKTGVLRRAKRAFAAIGAAYWFRHVTGVQVYLIGE